MGLTLTSADLKLLQENGMISTSDVFDTLKMLRRNEIIKRHPYAVWVDSNNRWHTYLPDEKKKTKRRLLNKKSREDIYNAIFEYYKTGEDVLHPTFRKVYVEWREHKFQMLSDRTEEKYLSDDKRFFAGTDFENILVEYMNENDIENFLTQQVKKYDLGKKAFNNLCGYVKETLEYARRNHFIRENPYSTSDVSAIRKLCRQSEYKPREKQILSKVEMKRVKDILNEYYKKKPTYIVPYVIEFCMLTGFRPGEAVALSWDRINLQRGIITVDRSEHSHHLTKPYTYTLGDTKNHKIRLFPITPTLRELLDRVKTAEMRQGYLSEFVFSDENGRITANKPETLARRVLIQAECEARCMTAFRKTFNSLLIEKGVSSVTRASLLGHLPEVNESNYSFDTVSQNEIARCLSQIYLDNKIV